MRQINLLIIHCSATKENHPFTIQALETSHRKRGFNGIGYHYYIRQSGEVINTRPLSRIGAHAKGYNRNSIGICYEGGLDKDGKPKDTRTPEQCVPALHPLGISLSILLRLPKYPASFVGLQPYCRMLFPLLPLADIFLPANNLVC